jgi:hypothetical protein
LLLLHATTAQSDAARRRRNATEVAAGRVVIRAEKGTGHPAAGQLRLRLIHTWDFMALAAHV